MRTWPLLLIAIALAGAAIPVVADCTQYNTNQTGCQGQSDCQWQQDGWGSWCEQKGCWNFWTNTSCISNTTNLSCSWQSGTSSWCEQKGCWSFEGTSSNACVNNSVGLNCTWSTVCVGPPDKNCWEHQAQANCTAVAGCSWGACHEKSCWDYTTNTTCVANVGPTGKACKWDSSSSNCYESGCWDYANSTSCAANGCKWSGGYCSQYFCSDFSYTNETACVNNSQTLKCGWSSPYCNEKGCWSYQNSGNCSADTKCNWQTQTGGWCQESECWNWDGVDQQGCEGNGTAYGLNCVWDPAGWCYENFSSTGCPDITDQRECIDTFYCVWNFTGSACQDPDFATQSFNSWNPGCYIFPTANLCGNISGCTWNAGTGECDGLQFSGISCANITNQSICNSIPVLGSCCSWNGSSCLENQLSTKCRDQMQTPPAGASYCEDYNSYTDRVLCEQIAGSPWFMPCKWSNGTSRCEFRHDKVFSQGESNLMLLDNMQSCEFAGGKWVTESYCDGAIAVPTGRCEFKFDEETNCDRACFACDRQSDGTNWTSLTQAREACAGSQLGICQFTENGQAPNSYGFCSVKEVFTKGIASGSCDTDCNACTYMGDADTSSADKRPSAYCKNSKAGCKWVSDPAYPTDESKGRCASSAEKTCEDRCDSCYDANNCVSLGAKKGDSSKPTQCEWDSEFYLCEPTGSTGLEVCWDGKDNNEDGKMDCADSKCFSDAFCGGAFFGGQDCFGYTSLGSCETEGCYWANESWGQWCDHPGAQCWKNDGTNEAACEYFDNTTCEWHDAFGGRCQEDFDVFDGCLGLNYSTCFNQKSNISFNCTWVNTSMFGGDAGFCDPNPAYQGGFYDCVQHDVNGMAVCEVAGTADGQGDKPCTWFNLSYGDEGGFCDHLRFSCPQNMNNASCRTVNYSEGPGSSWCEWMGANDTMGMCEGLMPDCHSPGIQDNQTACQAGSGCKWLSGFCDPKGFGNEFGSGGGFGMLCQLYNGDQNGCEGTSGCGWQPSPSSFCDANTSMRCPEQFNATLCNATIGCFWNVNLPQPGCDFKVWQCNQLGAGPCASAQQCFWDGFSCQPGCFDPGLDSTSCLRVNVSNASNVNGSACRWVNGFCDSAMAISFFKDIQGGEPIPLGMDAPGDAGGRDWSDIMGFGLKDMGASSGFGIRVSNIANSSMCKDQNLQGGGKGQGTNTSRFYWYLDTDGVRTGNCALQFNASAVGYEFLLSYEASWDGQSQSVQESFSSYRCAGSAWTLADIKLATFRKIACEDISGGMVAVEKLDLEKFPLLYSAGADWRVAVATADEAGNGSNVTDTAPPGFTTPGTVDFAIDSLDLFAYNANGSRGYGQEQASKGYIEYDADCWSAAGCAEYECYNHPYCVANSLGVHAAGFEDSRVPKIVAVSKESYPDGALITYFTDRPANGSLLFYAFDDRCGTLNATIDDVGSYSATVRDYKLWHTAEVYNDTDFGNHSLNYPLQPDTVYFFKLKICDENGKCGISKCSELRTARPDRCAFCDFVTQIKAPSGWNVSYDLDQDGTYEHVQGALCGPNAGMKANYTSGRRANIKLATSDNSSWLEFVSARLTKTGLTSRTRDVEESDALGSGTTNTTGGDTIGYAGMVSATRDKIVNNLFPEVCRIKIPGTGTCEELWHCSDNLSACVNRTAEATLLQSNTTYCLWQLPYCEFSAWAGGEADPDYSPPPPPPPPAPSGGGGGGGAPPTGAGNTSSKKWAEITPDKEAAMKIYSSAMGLRELVFQVTESVENAEIAVTRLGGKPSAASEEAPGTVYRYLDIAKSVLKDAQIRRVKFRFQVEKSWLESAGGTIDTVRLFRYTAGGWEPQITVFTDSDDTYHLFNASSTGMSYFAIGTTTTAPVEEPVEEPAAPTGMVPVAFPTPEVTGEATAPPETETSAGPAVIGRQRSILWTVFTAVSIAVLSVAGLGFLYQTNPYVEAKVNSMLGRFKREPEVPELPKLKDEQLKEEKPGTLVRSSGPVKKGKAKK